MGKPYQQENPKSTHNYVDKSPSLSEQFLERARANRDAGREYRHWVKCADIAFRLDHDLPVGRERRRHSRNRRADV
jgi:hypothetical protein